MSEFQTGSQRGSLTSVIPVNRIQHITDDAF